MKRAIRLYKNAFEMAMQTEDTDEYVAGWADIVRKDEHLLAQVRKMIADKKSAEAKTLAVLHCKHKKESIRTLADMIMKEEDFEVEDRTKIEL